LQIDQLVMSDGWFSLSLGENIVDEDRTAQGTGPLRSAGRTPSPPR